MKPITNLLITSYDKACAWKSFRPDSDDDSHLDNNRKYITNNDSLSSIEWMMEISRPLVERDYYYRKKYVYDYYFKLKNDIYVYAVQTNIKMNKYFYGKYHWYLDNYATRMFKMDQSLDLAWKDIFVSTYPVDDENVIFCYNYDVDSEYEEREKYDNVGDYTDAYIKKCLQRFYNLDETMYGDYYDEIFTGPYTSLRFFDDIPKEAILIDLPSVEHFDESSIAEQIALIITVSPSRCFDSRFDINDVYKI